MEFEEVQKQASFDQAASLYDRTFTESEIGKRQRARVYYWLNQVNFPKSDQRMFEINCGTGADAEYFYQKGVRVTATDGSPEMIQVARSSREKGIDFKVLDFSEVNETTIQGEAVFSNFGGLNCLNQTELIQLFERISKSQKKGDSLAVVIMPRFCLMEGLYFFARFKWGKLFRRNTANGLPVNVDGKAVMTYYHSPRSVKKMLPEYTIQLKKPVAICLPPSYLEPFFQNRPRFLQLLNALEKNLGRISLFSGWSDHYILVAEKK